MSDAVAGTHLFSYRYRGDDYVLELKAISPEDAKARLAQLTWARYDGELIEKSPALLSPWTPLECRVRNLFGRWFRQDL